MKELTKIVFADLNHVILGHASYLEIREYSLSYGTTFAPSNVLEVECRNVKIDRLLSKKSGVFLHNVYDQRAPLLISSLKRTDEEGYVVDTLISHAWLTAGAFITYGENDQFISMDRATFRVKNIQQF